MIELQIELVRGGYRVSFFVEGEVATSDIAALEEVVKEAQREILRQTAKRRKR